MKKEQIKKEDLMNASGGMKVTVYDQRSAFDRNNKKISVDSEILFTENDEIKEVAHYITGTQDYVSGRQNAIYEKKEFDSEEEALDYIHKNMKCLTKNTREYEIQ